MAAWPKIPFPEGRAGMLLKLALGLVAAFIWTNGSEEEKEKASAAKTEVEKRTPYSRHYAFKGRGRKEFLRVDVEDDRCELVPTRGATEA